MDQGVGDVGGGGQISCRFCWCVRERGVCRDLSLGMGLVRTSSNDKWKSKRKIEAIVKTMKKMKMKKKRMKD